MKRAWILLVLAACGSTSDIDAGRPDAPTAQEILCERVAMAYCPAQAGCRPGHPEASCVDQWKALRCPGFETLTDTSAAACSTAWAQAGTDCPAWWAADWWVTTAPSCAEIIQIEAR